MSTNVLLIFQVRNELKLPRMQIVQYDCGHIVRLPFSAYNTAAFHLEAPRQGSIVVTVAEKDGSCYITVHTMPRSSSPVHTNPYLVEYTLHSSSMLVLDTLLARYWGSP